MCGELFLCCFVEFIVGDELVDVVQVGDGGEFDYVLVVVFCEDDDFLFCCYECLVCFGFQQVYGCDVGLFVEIVGVEEYEIVVQVFECLDCDWFDECLGWSVDFICEYYCLCVWSVGVVGW